MSTKSALALVMVTALVIAGCTEAQAPEATSPLGQSVTPAPVTAAAVAAGPQTAADLFPAGAARDLVLNSCASCHNLACSVIGQRTAERWDSLKESHRDKVNADLDAIFAYLKANFDSTKPEPRVPPAFLEGGCTPF